MPFEFMGVNVAEILLYVAAVLSIVSAIQYFNANRKLSREEPKIINSK